MIRLSGTVGSALAPGAGDTGSNPGPGEKFSVTSKLRRSGTVYLILAAIDQVNRVYKRPGDMYDVLERVSPM